jgi:hypothetical protein
MRTNYVERLLYSQVNATNVLAYRNTASHEHNRPLASTTLEAEGVFRENVVPSFYEAIDARRRPGKMPTTEDIAATPMAGRRVTLEGAIW